MHKKGNTDIPAALGGVNESLFFIRRARGRCLAEAAHAERGNRRRRAAFRYGTGGASAFGIKMSVTFVKLML